MKLVAALLGLLMLVSCGGDDDVAPAAQPTSPPVVTTPPAVTPTTPSVTPTTPTVTPTTPSVSPTTPVVTPTVPACPAFTDSFGRAVSCTEMALLAGANLPFVEGGGGGTGDGTGDGGADGSAGDGAPIANTVLRFTDINGRQVTTTTDARGYFRISLRGLKAPLLASVQRDNKPWQSLLVTDIVRAPANRRFYTINLTGLSDVVASELAKRDGLANPQALTPAALNRQKAQVPNVVASLKNLIREQIEAAGLNFADFDPLNTPFEAVLSDRYDILLERVIVDKDPVGGFSVVTPRYGINPKDPTMLAGGSLDFSTNFTATFAVVGGDVNGRVSATGPGNATYVAPATPGVYRVVATSTNTGNRATATVTVSAGTGFRVTGAPRIAPNTSTQLTALFSEVSTSATWTIEGNCGACSVSSAGVFTAGSTVASVRVRGTRVGVPTQSDTVAITIASEVILSLNAPSAITVTSADMFTFNPTISPEGINADVSLAAAPAGDAGSFITVDYFKGYLPPARAGNFTIGVASVADPSKTGAISVAVTTPAATALVATPGAPASMRYTHAAAALPDGRVLMVGGLADRQSNNRLLSTEVFNPTAGSFSAGPNLGLARLNLEAIAIDANRVLVTGGELDYQTARNTAEVVNLSTRVSNPTPNAMSALRIHHRMVALTSGPNSGKVLVMGGFNGPVPYGVPTWQATASVDVFDPATDSFTPSQASLRTARGLFTATVLADGRVLIVGGFQPEPGPLGLASAEIYDPVAGTFTFTGAMSIARYGHTATRLADGRVLIVGGINNSNTHSTAEIYNPATGNFSPVTSTLAVTRAYHAAATLADGRVAIVGGESGEFVVRGTVEVFDPSTQSFSPYARMATPRVRATATTLTTGPNAGKVLVFGGGAVNTPARAAELTP